MFIYTHPQYPRTNMEKFFKYVYVFTALLLLSSFIITANEFTTKITVTYDDFWTGNLKIHPSLITLLDNCSSTASVQINGVSADTTYSKDTMEYLFLGTTALGVGVFFSMGWFIGVDLVTKLLYSLNIRNFRMRGIVFRIMWIQPQWLIVWCMVVALLVGTSSNARNSLHDYIENCAERMLVLDRDFYVSSEVDKETVFSTDFTFMIVSMCLNMGIYALAFLHILVYGCRKEQKELAKYEMPWETGCSGLPHKPMLTAWLGARRSLLDFLKTQTAPEGVEVDQQMLEDAVFMPFRHLSYFRTELSRKDVIDVVIGSLPQQQDDGAAGNEYYDPNAAYDPNGQYLVGEDGYQYGYGEEGGYDENVVYPGGNYGGSAEEPEGDPSRRKSRHRHSRHRSRGEEGAEAAGEEGEERHRHRRRRSKRNKGEEAAEAAE